MAKKTDIKLPKSVKKSDDKVQAKYIKAFKKSMDKHNDEERARKKAISKLQKKYEKVDKRWVRKDDATPVKAEKKADKKTEKKSDKKSTKKDGEKATLKDSKKSDKKKADKKKSDKPAKKDKKSAAQAEKKSGKSKDSKKKSKKSKSDDLLLEILSAEDFDADEMIEILEERVEDGENLTVEEASEEVAAMEDELLGLDEAEEALVPEVTEVGEYEGANPEEAEDPIAAQEAFEDSLAEPNLAEALDEEQDDAVQPEATENAQGVTAGRLISDVTRAELYKEAQELKIPGRASMNKEQLFAAIELAR